MGIVTQLLHNGCMLGKSFSKGACFFSMQPSRGPFQPGWLSFTRLKDLVISPAVFTLESHGLESPWCCSAQAVHAQVLGLAKPGTPMQSWCWLGKPPDSASCTFPRVYSRDRGPFLPCPWPGAEFSAVFALQDPEGGSLWARRHIRGPELSFHPTLT